MIKSLLLIQRAAPKVATSMTLTPPSLDLDPGESGTVVAQVFDQHGGVMNPTVVLPITAANIKAAIPGATVTINGASLTVVAPAIGPVNDVNTQADVVATP